MSSTSPPPDVPGAVRLARVRRAEAVQLRGEHPRRHRVLPARRCGAPARPRSTSRTAWVTSASRRRATAATSDALLAVERRWRPRPPCRRPVSAASSRSRPSRRTSGLARWSARSRGPRAGRPGTRSRRRRGRAGGEAGSFRCRTDRQSPPAAGTSPARQRQVSADGLLGGRDPAVGERARGPPPSSGPPRRSSPAGPGGARRAAAPAAPRRAGRRPRRAAATSRPARAPAWPGSRRRRHRGRDRVQHARGRPRGQPDAGRPGGCSSGNGRCSAGCSPTRSATRRASGIPSGSASRGASRARRRSVQQRREHAGEPGVAGAAEQVEARPDTSRDRAPRRRSRVGQAERGEQGRRRRRPRRSARPTTRRAGPQPFGTTGANIQCVSVCTWPRRTHLATRRPNSARPKPSTGAHDVALLPGGSRRSARSGALVEGAAPQHRRHRDAEADA